MWNHCKLLCRILNLFHWRGFVVCVMFPATSCWKSNHLDGWPFCTTRYCKRGYCDWCQGKCLGNFNPRSKFQFPLGSFYKLTRKYACEKYEFLLGTIIFGLISMTCVTKSLLSSGKCLTIQTYFLTLNNLLRVCKP